MNYIAVGDSTTFVRAFLFPVAIKACYMNILLFHLGFFIVLFVPCGQGSASKGPTYIVNS